MTTGLMDRLRTRTARVAVAGLGYVGLPLAVEHAKAGFEVVGIDVDARRVEAVNEGASYLPDVDEVALKEALKSGRLRATTDSAQIASCDVLTICVPTPLGEHKEPDTRFIEAVVDAALPHLHSGMLVVLESTTYPGTTEEIVAARIRARGLEPGRDVHVVFSPERIDPGNRAFPLRQIPKVVGGLTPACSEAARVLYEASLGRVFVVSSPRAAEMTKLLENIFRIVNVSLVNELAMLCDRMGVDVWEVIEAAKTKPFGFMPFYPGPGMGGHCIPVDAFYLSWKAKEHGFSTRFVELAGEVNDAMPQYVVHRAMEILNDAGRPLRGSRVLLLGLAYKRDVPDLRESPALAIGAMLLDRGADVRYHDPFVPAARIAGRSLDSSALDAETIERADLVLVTTDHTAVDYELVRRHARLVFDTRNALRDARGDPRVHTLGSGRAPPPRTAHHDP